MNRSVFEALAPAHCTEHCVVSRSESDASFLQKAASSAARPHAVVLLSGGNLDCSRYSLVAWNPFLLFEAKGFRISIRVEDTTWTFHDHPLDALDSVITRTSAAFPFLERPFSGGLVGYVAYELKNTLESLPQSAEDDLNLPDIYLFIPRDVLVHDRKTRRLVRLRFQIPGIETSVSDPSSTGRSGTSNGYFVSSEELRSDFTHEEYLRAVHTIREYIRRGDVYQVNLSQRFSAPFSGDAWKLWTALFERNPAPFYAYVNAGTHQILSTSMERFLARRGKFIETRPIKGTRPRGATPEEDRGHLADLVSHPKDDAELSMIVDLLRNDLGRVCRSRTIRVVHHKRVESYQNVHHLISIITGALREDVSHGAVLKATFPGGSITGCPKIRAMEIIDELEKHVRHVYTGSIGYFGWHDNMDLNIAIRTAVLKDGCIHFSVGGGVVYDSDEESEYQETLHKGRTFFKTLEKEAKTEGKVSCMDIRASMSG